MAKSTHCSQRLCSVTRPKRPTPLLVSLVTIALLAVQAQTALAGHNYADALYKSILFFEQQRSGRLPSDHRADWRANSALRDGSDVRRDLTGGYYDAGDNVKFGFPMAFTISTMAWGVAEFYEQLQSAGQLQYALAAIKWGTDYFIKAHPEPNVLYGQVGEGQADHSCWMRPEDMDTPRTSYKIDTKNPGTELAAETAAAMAAAAVAFERYNPSYASELLGHAKQLFSFANNYRGTYTRSVNAGGFYPSYSGYNDELLWAAAWLYRASGDSAYLDFAATNGASLGGTTSSLTRFSWDNKYVGAQILMAKVLFSGKAGRHAGVLTDYKRMAELFMCSALQMNRETGQQMPRTPGGMIYVDQWSPIQYVSSASLAVSVYADYLREHRRTLTCSGTAISPDTLHKFVRSQVDYVLGSNPSGQSYMVGYGSKFPRRAHHRAASLPSIRTHPQKITCNDGWTFYRAPVNNKNILTGALVGGPDSRDNFLDDRDNYRTNEPITYLNSPFIGVLARIVGGYRGAGREGGGPVPTPKSPPPRRRSPPPPRRSPPPPKRSPPPPKKRKHPPGVGKHPPGVGGHKRRPPPPRPGSPPPPQKKSPPPRRSAPPPRNRLPPPKRSPPPTRSPPPSNAGMKVSLSTAVVSAWKDERTGRPVAHYTVTITNRTGRQISNLQLAVKNYRSNNFWGLVLSNGNSRATLPSHAKTLPNGGAYTFGYIQVNGPITFSVISFSG